ncbi:MAG: hypothetical protein KDE27_11580 [Planctomycetes bacterium]|nr:hypothetical protein [Planctomycetota bacterium]
MALAACSTTSPLAEVRKLPPSPITVLIDDFPELPRPPASGEGLYMEADAARLRDLLAAGLGAANAASRVVRRSELADPNDADVVLRPRLAGPVNFRYEGWSSGWWAAGGLWLVTWIGGLAVDDATYRSDLRLVYELEFPRSEHVVNRTSDATACDLAFLERNDFFSWSTLQTLILPPFLTSDQSDTTREALTRRAVEEVAIDVARYLKGGFDGDALQHDLCMIRFDAPTNGSAIAGDRVVVRGTVTPQSPVRAVLVALGDGEPSEAKFTPLEPPDLQYPNGGTFECTVSGLRPGPNYLRVIVGAGDLHTRTLLVTRQD